MTNNDFYTLVSCIARAANQWLHEGVVMQLNRNKGDKPIRDEAVKSFCKEVRGLLEEIESRVGAVQ